MRPFLEDKSGQIIVSPSRVEAYPEHLHSHAELLYLFEGSALLKVDGRQQLLSAGDLCVCFPSVVHSYESGADARALMLIFPPELSADFPALLTQSYPSQPVVRRQQLPEDVPLCMQQLWNECHAGNDPRVLRGYIQVILSRVLPLLTLIRQPPAISDIVYDILQYLSLHYREPLKLEDLSRALGVSKSCLSHAFSRRIGVHFRTYLNALRAERARLLLRSSSQSILAIALECGFESQRSFNRAFLEMYGVSPSQYRKQRRF